MRWLISQSKYCVTPSLAVLREIRRRKGSFAVVALPCQVHALRKMAQVDRGLAAKITYILGLYCHCTMEVSGHQEAIEAKLAKRHLQDGALLLYDLTTVYMEGQACELGAYGRGKEGRHDKLQIVVGLLCNREGIPVSVQVFEGNASECLTLGDQVAKGQL